MQIGLKLSSFGVANNGTQRSKRETIKPAYVFEEKKNCRYSLFISFLAGFIQFEPVINWSISTGNVNWFSKFSTFDEGFLEVCSFVNYSVSVIAIRFCNFRTILRFFTKF